mgnify:CR=1 FL=1
MSELLRGDKSRTRKVQVAAFHAWWKTQDMQGEENAVRRLDAFNGWMAHAEKDGDALRALIPEELRPWLRGFVKLCPYFGSTEEAISVWLSRASIMDKIQEQYLQKANEMTRLLKGKK